MVRRKVKFTVTEKREIEVDVEYPIYRKHDLLSDHSDVVIYTRFGADDLSYSIHETRTFWGSRQHLEYQMTVETDSLSGNDLDYALGQGRYKSSATEFMQVVERMAKAVHTIPLNESDDA